MDLYNIIIFFKFRFFLAKTRCQIRHFFILFLNVFFGGLHIKNNERKRIQIIFFKRVSQKYFPLIFKFFKVLLSKMVIAGYGFACILVWYSRNRIKVQTHNISVQRIRYFRWLRFVNSGSNWLTEPKFKTRIH